MEVTFTLSQITKLIDPLSKMLPQRGRSAFESITLRKMPDEKVHELRVFVNKINILTAAKISPQSVTIPYEQYELIMEASETKSKIF